MTEQTKAELLEQFEAIKTLESEAWTKLRAMTKQMEERLAEWKAAKPAASVDALRDEWYALNEKKRGLEALLK